MTQARHHFMMVASWKNPMKYFATPRIALTSTLVLIPTLFAQESSWQTLMNTGNRLMEDNRYIEATLAFQRAVEDARASGNAAQVGAGLDSLGVIYDVLDQPQESEMCYLRATEVLESAGTESYPYLTRVWMDLGSLYLKLGRYARAHELVERALGVLTRDALGQTIEVASLLTELGRIEELQHKKKDAEGRWRRAMMMLEQAGRSHSREWIAAANNLGTLLINAGRKDEGGFYLEHALARGETTLNTRADQLVLARVLLNISYRDLAARHFDQAEKHASRALEISQRELGTQHAFTGEALEQNAAICRATKRKAEAMEYERRAKNCLGSGAHAAFAAHTVSIEELRTR